MSLAQPRQPGVHISWIAYDSWRLMNRTIAHMLFVSSALAIACDGGEAPKEAAVDEAAPAAPPAAHEGADAPAAKTPAAAEPEPGSAPAAEESADSLRADAPLSVGAKAVRSLGFRNKALVGMYALKASVRTPSWGESGESVASTRDDDLLTAWRCTATETRPCAVELQLPEESSVVALRLYGAAGTRGADVEPAKQTVSWPNYKAHPRPAKIRVHTRAGYVDATLKDGADDRYLVFESPVSTDVVTVEVTDLHAGKKNAELRLAELEVFGTTGTARAPLSLDPERTYVRYETTPWGGSSIRQVFLEEAGDTGRRRLMRATALYGTNTGVPAPVAASRYLLVERMFKTTCDSTEGSYTLLDTKTRVPWALGALGGIPGNVYPAGEDAEAGFVVIPPSGDEAEAKTLVVEAGAAKIRRGTEADLEYPIARGSGWIHAVPSTCGYPDAEALAATGLADRYDDVRLNDVLRCNIGGSKVYFTQFHDCDKRWSVVLVGNDGARIDELHNEDDDGRGLRYGILAGGEFLVETTSKGGDVTQLHHVAEQGIQLFADRAAFAVRPPASCRPCSDTFREPGKTAPSKPLPDVAEPDAE